MDMFVVRGGRPLQGTIAVSGAKNACLPMMAAALAIDGPVHLRAVPQLADVATLSQLLTGLGVSVTRDSAAGLRLEVTEQQSCLAPYDLVRRMRASICVLGPLLARRGRACVSLPGGCNIGHRPVDVHLRGLQALGARVEIENGYVIASAGRLKGAEIDLTGPAGSTVTGTCNVLTAACLAEGRSVLTGAAREPEVVDLGLLLIAAGARIHGLGSATLIIDGVDQLHSAEHSVIPDRIEAATLMLAAAITRGELTLENVVPEHLTAVIDTLREAGVTIDVGAGTLQVAGTGDYRPVDVTARPYPGFPTDVQAQMTAFLSRVAGQSRVRDDVFPDRFMHLPELCRLGAAVRREGTTAVVAGVPRLSGASVMASDLRASAALILAALAAEGESVIRRVYHLDRGYEALELKLRQVGADIQRVCDEEASDPAPAPHFLQRQLPSREIPSDTQLGSER